MASNIIANVPHTRCYKCNQAKVDMMCHHCGRAICQTHGPTFIPKGNTIENTEFSQLGLEGNVGETGIHCKDCIHFVCSHKKRMIITGIISVFCLFMIWNPFHIYLTTELREISGWGYESNTILWGMIFLVSFFFFLKNAFEHLNNFQYWEKISDHIPLLPVIGSIESVSVKESLHGEIQLHADGRYTTKVEQPKGNINFNFHLDTTDKERVPLYLTKLKKQGISSIQDRSFHAGFAVLPEGAALNFETPDTFMPNCVNTIQFTGKVKDQPYLSDPEVEDNDKLKFSYTYTFSHSKGKEVFLPLEIFPAFVQGGDQHEIELIFQLSADAKNLSSLRQARIEELQLYIPQNLGKINDVEPAAVINQSVEKGEGNFCQLIKWTGVNIKSNGFPVLRKTFYIRFENPIGPETIFNGNLKITFSKAFSDLGANTSTSDEPIVFFYPLGNKREGVYLHQTTILDVEFNLELEALRFQETFLKNEPFIERKGIVPNHEVVRQLTDAVSDNNFYIKRVIENPPRTSKASAHIMNYYWDIAGRFYKGFYPIDFHIVISGEENYLKPPLSKTRIDITVQGLVTDKDVQDQVEYTHERLMEIMEDVLEQIPQMTMENTTEGQEEFEVTEEKRAPEPEQPTQPDRITELRSRLDKLDNVLLEGRISEERYTEMRERYERELREIEDNK